MMRTTLALVWACITMLAGACSVSTTLDPSADAGPAPVDLGRADAFVAPIDAFITPDVLNDDHDVATRDAAPPSDTGPSQSRTYVVARVMTATADPSQAYGFDLDHMMNGMTGSCTDAADFVSPITGNTAVDNQLSTALPVLGSQVGPDGADGAIRMQIESGTFLLVMTVSEIDSYLDDPAVMVHLVLGRSAAGAPTASAACAAHVDQASCEGDATNACGWSASTSSCSGIAAGQTFSTAMDLGTASGAITHGHLDAEFAMLPLPLTTVITIQLHNARVGGRITASSISGGEIGGGWAVSDILAAVAVLGIPIDLATLESVIQPDLSPDAMGVHCGSVSSGVGYDAITATLVP